MKSSNFLFRDVVGFIGAAMRTIFSVLLIKFWDLFEDISVLEVLTGVESGFVDFFDGFTGTSEASRYRVTLTNWRNFSFETGRAVTIQINTFCMKLD